MKDVYFINAKALALSLKDGAISEYTALKHFIVSMIIGGFTIKIPVVFPIALNGQPLGVDSLPVISFIIISIITYYGSVLAYQINTKGDGKSFFLRFLTLSLPVTIQVLLISLFIAVLLYFTAKLMIPIDIEIAKIIADSIIFIAEISLVAFFFLQLRKYFKIAAGFDESSV